MLSSADRAPGPLAVEVARYAYDPYGNSLVSQAPGTLAERNPLRYRGYCYDAESGYYHMPARYYDPASARFVSVDPAAPSAGDPVSLNGYSYCFGDPVGLVDPDGRDVLYGEYYSDEQDPTGELDANLPDHDGAGVGKPPSEKVWKANNAVAAQQGARASREAEERRQARALSAADVASRALVGWTPGDVESARYGPSEERAKLGLRLVAGTPSAAVMLGIFAGGLLYAGWLAVGVGGPAGWVFGGALIVVAVGVAFCAVKAAEVETGSDFNLPWGL